MRDIHTRCREEGSPPRVRGKVDDLRLGGGKVGITPACAGKRLIFRGGAYPLRITPACAGKRVYFLSRSDCVQDHPRVCGEKISAMDGGNGEVGSPPRVRGKEQQASQPTPLSGITPACAGKSLPPSPSCIVPGDHPRVCGEKCLQLRTKGQTLGSPPRVRGKVLLTFANVESIRITPACAGKRPRFPPERQTLKDHPRVCGEKTASARFFCSSAGSPPRVRGKD